MYVTYEFHLFILYVTSNKKQKSQMQMFVMNSTWHTFEPE